MRVERPLIFIVDDEEDVARLTAKRIGALGYEVACFFEGEGAVEAIQRKKPDLVLLDIRLPDISGLEIYRKLRADESLRHIPIVFFSAHGSQEGYCLGELGAEGFVKKPYDPQALKELIRRLLLETDSDRRR